MKKKHHKKIKKHRTLEDVRITNILKKLLDGLEKTVALLELSQMEIENQSKRLDRIKMREQIKIEEL